MAKFNNCFGALVGRKTKHKGDEESSNTVDYNKGLKTFQVRLEQPVKSWEINERKSTSFSVPVPFAIRGSSRCKVKVMSHESPVGGEVEEVHYEGEDEHGEKRDYSDCDLQSQVGNSNDENNQSLNERVNVKVDREINDQFKLRVDEWVKEVSNQPPFLVDSEDQDEDAFFPQPSPNTGRSKSNLTYHPIFNLPEEIVHANSLMKSINSSSTGAHMSGIGLKAIPTISHFSGLRSINLSGNYIVQIPQGSLPKGLHSLNLSRNKISTIDGIRELTRLRILDLSYNRVSRIGQGLSNCTLIKELYLARNKISDVEGLHRLLKLIILDLSLNRITTAKALGQLVANYNSILALNILGNPIQSNISDDQLRKAVCGLLPKLAYLNKQPVDPQKAREVSKEAIAKAALGNSGRGARRKAVKRVSQGGSSSSVGHKSRHRLRSRTHQHSPLKAKPSALDSSSR